MIDITSSVQLDKLDTYTKGHVNFRKEDYYSFSYRRYNLFFDKDSGVLRFISSENAIYDVKNKFYEEIEEKMFYERKVERLDDAWIRNKIRYAGSAREKVKTVAFDALKNNFLSDKNDDKYRVIVYTDGSMIDVYKKNGEFVCKITNFHGDFEIYNLFADKYFTIYEKDGEFYDYIFSYFEKCDSLLFNDLVKTLAK